MRPLILAAACIAACLVGCGSRPKLAAVTGTVVYRSQPLTAGSILLHPVPDNAWSGEKPTSVLQTDGSFTMKTYPHGNGVPPGSYKVTLGPSLAGRIGKPEYGDPKKTPWTIDVPEEGVAGQVFEVK